jgi:hypothetical protein
MWKGPPCDSISPLVDVFALAPAESAASYQFLMVLEVSKFLRHSSTLKKEKRHHRIDGGTRVVLARTDGEREAGRRQCRGANQAGRRKSSILAFFTAFAIVCEVSLRGPRIHARQHSVVVLAHPGVTLAGCALELATIFDGDLATPFLDRTALHQIAYNARGISALYA